MQRLHERDLVRPPARTRRLHPPLPARPLRTPPPVLLARRPQHKRGRTALAGAHPRARAGPDRADDGQLPRRRPTPAAPRRRRRRTAQTRLVAVLSTPSTSPATRSDCCHASSRSSPAGTPPSRTRQAPTTSSARSGGSTAPTATSSTATAATPTCNATKARDARRPRLGRGALAPRRAHDPDREVRQRRRDHRRPQTRTPRRPRRSPSPTTRSPARSPPHHPLESGNVYLPGRAAPDTAAGYHAPDWVASFIEEAATFPNGKHDDQVDAFSQAINWARGHAHRPARFSLPRGRIPDNLEALGLQDPNFPSNYAGTARPGISRQLTTVETSPPDSGCECPARECRSAADCHHGGP